jgi:Zn-dependent protease
VISTTSLLEVVYLIVGIVIALVGHEYAHAYVASRLGDHMPRHSGRLTLNPRPHVDPFGSLLLPGILLVPVLFGRYDLFPIFAYAKPMQFNPWTLRRRDRDATLIALAGPAANLVLAFVIGSLLRLTGPAGRLSMFLGACLHVTLSLAIFNLLPIPGLDGSKIVVRFLSGRVRDVYSNLDQYLPLFILVIFFIFNRTIFSLVNAVASGICHLVAGAANC